jgi:outer membrane cobalamin receptor
VVTDSRGRFEVEGLAWGERPVILVSSRCSITTATVVVSEVDRREYHLTLPQEIADRQREDMRARAEGIYMTADEIMATRARRMIDVVRRVAPQMVGAPGVQPGDVSPVRGRNRSTASGVTEPVLVVDGAVLGRGDRILSDLAPGEVAALEILKGAAGGWMYGSEGAGGVIRVWTKRGGAASAPVGPESCEVPGW